MGVPNDFATVQRVWDENPQFHGSYSKSKSAYMTRLVAVALNPSGDPNGWGLLSKQPGENQVNGVAIDAIIWAPTYQVVDIISDADGRAPKPTWQVGGRPRSGNEWAVPTLTGVPDTKPNPNPQPPDDDDEEEPWPGPSGPYDPSRPTPGPTVGEGRMPSMPGNMRPEAYQVADAVYKEMQQLDVVPVKEGSDENLPDSQVKATHLAVAAIAAVAADWAMAIADTSETPDTQTATDDLDSAMGSIFPE